MAGTELLFGLLLATLVSITKGWRYDQPFFMILPSGSATEKIFITTRQCMSGSFTNSPVHLQSFCLTGVWVLSDAVCNEEGQHYLVTGRESCFTLEEPIEIRRFQPILQKIDDFEGYAFLMPNHYGYFIHLNPDEPTEIKPIAEPRSKYKILEVNFGIMNRFLNEMEEGLEGNKTCYVTDPSAVVQVFEMKGDGTGDTVFKAYAEQEHCSTGYDQVGDTFRIPIGTIRFLSSSEERHFNSTLNEESVGPEDLYDLSVPFPATTVSGACSSESVTHPKYNLSIPNERSPIFPHMLPEKDSEDIISDEIRETTRQYLDYNLHGGKIPKINLTEYKYVSMSTNIVGKYCCHPGMNPDHMRVIRLLFRMSATYYFQYFPYVEKPEPEQSDRIIKSLQECLNRTDVPPEDVCITPNFTDGCPRMINNTNWNKTMYGYDLPAEIEFELGNLDYITEAIWKAQLFVHYFCSNFFSDPSDHSAFDARVESFFNPLILKKWIQPRGVHAVYELLLNGINLPMLAEAMDSCVYTAREISEYKRWLSRPADIAKRKKRAAKAPEDSNCVPANTPKYYCLDKQFDILEKKLMHPFEQSAVKSCNNVFSKRQSLKYIHSNAYGVPYT